MNKDINILDHKYQQFRTWIVNIKFNKGEDKTLTVAQIVQMLDFLDSFENDLDDILVDLLGKDENQTLSR